MDVDPLASASSSAQPSPNSDPDLLDAGVVAEVFHRAAEANLKSAGRQGAVVDLPGRGRVVMTGDLHDHGLNFQRVLKLAGLGQSRDNYLILHEIIHGPGRVNGRDLSVRLLARVAALKLQYPDQVLLLQANHELAQLGGEGILKDGTSVVQAFNAGLEFLYGDEMERVHDAMVAFIRTLLLGVRCANGVFCSHSLPSPRKLERFDARVIERVPTEADLAVDGAGYLMVWGRNHTQELADALGRAWGAKVFVMGHQPAEMGYEVEGESMIVLASDHSHGVALPMDLSRAYERDELVEQIVPLAAVVL
jgi:hypothetical protein